ncbi:MAG: UDP-N-acetylmuramate dehydrogenase [Spirochaetaceae bacterium]|jgi:UDP-N-acetylmuramate dehydrogenase|nr:UDP-N-acetylmuramate dehydrogenase [Spirochaetaceae bacterium]
MLPVSLRAFMRENEPLAERSTFKIGGAARFYAAPPGRNFVNDAILCRNYAREKDVPFFVLGGASNLCISDGGIRGVVLDSASLSLISVKESGGTTAAVNAQAGALNDAVAIFAQEHGLKGLEFLRGLPGSAGGAVFMNARCFEKSISDVLISVEYINEKDEICVIRRDCAGWGYKKSPFQGREAIILSASFAAEKAVNEKERLEIKALCDAYYAARKEKGHFRHPSAGSVFKNNRAFGKSSGAIVEELNMRGKRAGGALIAPWHGNFIINAGGASCRDVMTLVDAVKDEALKRLGFALEEEIIFAGEER